MPEIACSHCSAQRLRPTGEVNRARKFGKPLYCSRECGNAARSARAKPAMGWHERRFEERPGMVAKSCLECGKVMWLPPSKAEEYKRCGSGCNRAWNDSRKKVAVVQGERVNLDRPCETCGKTFRPRPRQLRMGHGRYCSQACNSASREALAATDMEVRKAGIRKARQEGRWTVLSGERNVNWKGGKDAQWERRRPKAREWLREYRAKNADKVREWRHRRGKGKVMPRLPYGTIPKLGLAQRWKCAICRVGVRRSYHVDHIMPIAKGGAHEPRNLQLLCKTCNLRKSAKDPITYMQELGRLL